MDSGKAPETIETPRLPVSQSMDGVAVTSIRSQVPPPSQREFENELSNKLREVELLAAENGIWAAPRRNPKSQAAPRMTISWKYTTEVSRAIF